MPRSHLFLTCALFGSIAVAMADVALAQATSPWVPPLAFQTDMPAPPGAYLSWYKLLLVAIFFLMWVATTDWVNRDAMKIGSRTEMPPEVWNPILAGPFLVGFLCVLLIPIFWIGFSIYLLSTIVPFLIYFFVRRPKLIAEPDILALKKAKPGSGPPPAPPLPQDQGAEIEFVPAGSDSQQRQQNLIQARRSPEFPAAKNVLADLIGKRAEAATWDYHRSAASGRFQVDGVWHQLPGLERQVADPILVSLKHLANLQPADRRSRQDGSFQMKFLGEKIGVQLTTQGVPTGERAQIKFLRKTVPLSTFAQLGMFPEMIKRLKSSVADHCITIITAPPREGLTSTWQVALQNSGQLTRDCVALVQADDNDSKVENIQIKEYESPDFQIELLRATLLTQPDLLAVPVVESPEMMDALVNQTSHHDRSVMLRVAADSAAEGLLELLARANNKSAFLAATKLVVGQKLIRRLCPDCRREVRAKPEMMKRLGGDPTRQSTLFDHFRLPPPEQRVDEKGKPIEFPPCKSCGGLGYLGRIAIFEFLEIDDQLREVISNKGDHIAIEKSARQRGKLSLTQQAQRLVLLGVTSPAEVQRVFKQA